MQLPIIKDLEYTASLRQLIYYYTVTRRHTLLYTSSTTMFFRNRTLFNINGHIYWAEKDTIVMHRLGDTWKCNKKYKKQFNWSKTIANGSWYATIEWVDDDYFTQLVLSINDIQFKNVKQQKQTLSNFGVWLQKLKNSENTQNQQV